MKPHLIFKKYKYMFKMSLLLSSHVVRAFYLYGECVARPLSYPLIKKGMNSYSKKYR
nr:MAG TPA: hypothetical protein [Caudoviricetes sp.]